MRAERGSNMFAVRPIIGRLDKKKTTTALLRVFP
jgi:hypothetical protein